MQRSALGRIEQPRIGQLRPRPSLDDRHQDLDQRHGPRTLALQAVHEQLAGTAARQNRTLQPESLARHRDPVATRSAAARPTPGRPARGPSPARHIAPAANDRIDHSVATYRATLAGRQPIIDSQVSAERMRTTVVAYVNEDEQPDSTFLQQPIDARIVTKAIQPGSMPVAPPRCDCDSCDAWAARDETRLVPPLPGVPLRLRSLTEPRP